jgi:hypothetical protein
MKVVKAFRLALKLFFFACRLCLVERKAQEDFVV